MAVRVVLAAATLAWLLDVVLEHPAPLVMAAGIVPLGWIALEALWHLTADKRKEDC
jgi:hypothetical protein